MAQSFVPFKAKGLASVRRGFDQGVNSKLPRAQLYGPRRGGGGRGSAEQGVPSDWVYAQTESMQHT